jgi:cytochrome c
VASRYAGQADAENYLVGKIIRGGGGVWGEQAMAAHPQLAEEDARAMVRYIRSLAGGSTLQRLPASGTYRLDAHRRAEQHEGLYFVRAAYTDQGGEAVGALSGQQLIVLRHPNVEAESFDRAERVLVANGTLSEAYDGSFVVFEEIDLTGVTAVYADVLPPATGTDGGRLELRLGGVDGRLVGMLQVGEAPAGEVRTELEPVVGRHNLYLVFKANRDTGHPLARVDRLRFVLAE